MSDNIQELWLPWAKQICTTALMVDAGMKNPTQAIRELRHYAIKQDQELKQRWKNEKSKTNNQDSRTQQQK